MLLFKSVKGSASPAVQTQQIKIVFVVLCWFEVKARLLPSGDHLGLVEDFSPNVVWKEPLPSVLDRKICVTNSLLSAVIISLTMV